MLKHTETWMVLADGLFMWERLLWLSAGFFSACVQYTFRETVCRRVKQRVIVCSEATSTVIYTAISEQAGRASVVSGSPTGETSAVKEAGGESGCRAAA
jgi:hypothetical protein